MGFKKLPVTSIQRFSTHDGPGIRTTVFLKGCPLNCVWCHNPEAKQLRQEIFFVPDVCLCCRLCETACNTGAHSFQGSIHFFDASRCMGCLECTRVCSADATKPVCTQMSVDEIMDVICKDQVFYDGGGVTLSGGEPLMHLDGSMEILRQSKENGISTAVETSGFFDCHVPDKLASLTDIFLWDFKDGNPKRHKKNTGVSNEKILHNLFGIDKYAKKILLRCVMVKGINMDETHLQEVARIYHRLKNCTGIELIPYHPYGGSKHRHLGYGDNANAEWIPTAESLDHTTQTLLKLGCFLL